MKTRNQKSNQAIRSDSAGHVLINASLRDFLSWCVLMQLEVLIVVVKSSVLYIDNFIWYAFVCYSGSRKGKVATLMEHQKQLATIKNVSLSGYHV